MPELLISSRRPGVELQIGAAGVEADSAVDVLLWGRAEEFSIQRDRSGDVGEGYILGMALDGDSAAHSCAGDGRAAAVMWGGRAVMAESSMSPWLAVATPGL